jgi:hypothetical protein
MVTSIPFHIFVLMLLLFCSSARFPVRVIPMGIIIKGFNEHPFSFSQRVQFSSTVPIPSASISDPVSNSFYGNFNLYLRPE